VIFPNHIALSSTSKQPHEIGEQTDALLERVDGTFQSSSTSGVLVGASVEIWTAFSDCGTWFQKGETYLVYANRLAGAGLGNRRFLADSKLADAGAILPTGSCNRAVARLRCG